MFILKALYDQRGAAIYGEAVVLLLLPNGSVSVFALSRQPLQPAAPPISPLVQTGTFSESRGSTCWVFRQLLLGNITGCDVTARFGNLFPSV